MLANPFASPFGTTLVAAYLLAGLVGAAVAGRWLGRREWTREITVRLGAAWLAAATVEYWGAGPWSFVRLSIDLDFSLTQHLFLVKTHTGGQFSHAFGGGTDVAAMSFLAGQYVSLERILLTLFPLWIAQGLQKLMAFGLGFVGTYLICRQGARAQRPIAFGLAALYPVAEQSFTNITWGMGLGYALIPLAVHVAVARIGRRGYWWGVAALSLLHAISSAPSHTGLAFFPAVVAAAVMLRPGRLPRVLGGCLVLAAALAVNWADSLLAKAQLAPWTFRSAYADLSLAGVLDGAQRTAQAMTSAWEPFVLGLAAMALLLGRRQWSHAATTGGGLLLAGGLGTALQGVPWTRLGAVGLNAINFFYVTYAFIFIGLLAFALAARGGRIAAMTTIGLAAGHLASLVTYNAAVWLSEGGLSTVERGVQRLEARDWGREETVRVVSLPYRLPANIAPIAGLHSADGGYNLILKTTGDFWLANVVKGPLEIEAGWLSLQTNEWNLKCCARNDITAHVDLDGLRILNVKYVLSALPLEGAGLRQVAGPGPNEAVPPRAGTPLAGRLAAYFRLIAEPPPLRVYALDDPLPRLFAATAVVQAEDAKMVDAVRRAALGRAAVVRGGDSGNLREGALPAMNLRRAALVRDGVEAEVEAPQGGVLVVNIPYTPFWTAQVDGISARLIPVNMVHMAVMIPPGAASVSLRYHRPGPGERIAARMR